LAFPGHWSDGRHDGLRNNCDAWALSSSEKLCGTQSVSPIADLDLGMFAVAEIAIEDTNAVSPMHLVPNVPNAEGEGTRRCRAPTTALAGFARLTRW